MSARLPSRWNPQPTTNDWIARCARALGVDVPASDDPLFNDLARALTMPDRLADELADWYKHDKANAVEFDAFLARGGDDLSHAPEMLRRLEGELLSVRPEWADPEKMMVGSRAHLRIGIVGRIASGTLGLLDGYRCVPIAKTLTMTGSLDRATAKRLDETSRFFTEIIMSEGMRRGSAGFRAAIKVRLVHSFVRHGLAASPRWRRDEWGMPITIMDSLGTAMSFWIPVLLAAPRFGYTVSREEAEGMMILWNYVGYLQGVPEELLPTTLEETYRIYLGILMQIGEPNEDSVKLARAYIDAAAQKGGQSNWLNEKMITGAAARLLPPSHRRELEVPNTLFRYWIDAMRPAIRRKDRACHRDPAAYEAAVAEGRQLFAADLESDAAPETDYDPDAVVTDHSALRAA